MSELSHPTQTAPRAALQRPMALASHWDNVYLLAAMPLLLLAERVRDLDANGLMTVRGQLVMEIQAMRKRLALAAVAPTELDDASYAVCTYLDEIINDRYRWLTHPPPAKSLLVEFHGNAWGGEAVFNTLEAYMDHPDEVQDLLVLYDYLLALGLEGKHRLVPHGALLLSDLRSRLHGLRHEQPPSSLTVGLTHWGVRRKPWITPQQLALAALVTCVALYGIASWLLLDHARPVIQDILNNHRIDVPWKVGDPPR